MQARRVLVLGDVGGPLSQWRIEASLGINIERLEDAPVSLTLLEEVARSGTPQLVADVQAQGLDDRFSPLVGEVHSFACLPFHGQQGEVAGLIYADSSMRGGFFGPRQMAAAQRLVQRLERDAYGRESETTPPPIHMKALQAVPQRIFKPAAIPVQPLELPERALWLRSLAAMVSSGLTLDRGLDVLSQSAPRPDHARALQQMNQRLFDGHPLHQALSEPPGYFSLAQLQLIRAGERSGALVKVLQRLADHEERLGRHRQKLRGALLYPGVVLVLALLMLTVLTPWVLKGQIQVLQQSGQALPWFTRMLALWAYHPLEFAFAGALLVGLAYKLGRSWASSPGGVAWLYASAVLGPLLRSSAAWRFCQSYALLQEAGINLPETLRQAADASLYPPLQASMADSIRSILGGSTVAEALGEGGHLSPLIVETVRVGEESGKVSEMLYFAASLSEMQFESGLETWSQALEPLLLGVMGLFVGAVLLATLGPTLTLLSGLQL